MHIERQNRKIGIDAVESVETSRVLDKKGGDLVVCWEYSVLEFSWRKYLPKLLGSHRTSEKKASYLEASRTLVQFRENNGVRIFNHFIQHFRCRNKHYFSVLEKLCNISPDCRKGSLVDGLKRRERRTHQRPGSISTTDQAAPSQVPMNTPD